MKKRAVILSILLIFAVTQAFAQDLRKKAEGNPLDCAFYLLSKDEYAREAENVAKAFFEVGRYDDTIAALEFEKINKLNILILFAKKLIEDGKIKDADKFLKKISVLLSEKEGEESRANKHTLIELSSILIKLNKFDEAISLVNNAEYESEKVTIAIGISRAFIEANQMEMALKISEDFYDVAENDDKAEIIEIYARLKRKDEAKNLLVEFEPTAFIGEKFYHNRRFILFPLINANLALREIDHALELWQQYGEVDDGYGYIKLIDALFEFGFEGKAVFYLNQIAADRNLIDDSGAEIVKRYLQINDLTTAIKLAKEFSNNVDNYEQQSALMFVADRLIKDGKTNSALEILDFAFQRAKKIIFAHETMQSFSSGTRKRGYLSQIYDRLIKLKNFKKAYEVIMAINSDHWIAKEFVSEKLVDLAGQQIKTLPRRKIDELLAQAQNLFKDDIEEYRSNLIEISSAHIYGQLGEKKIAMQLLTKVLEKNAENFYLNDFLLSSGIVFEKNKLKADAEMQNELRRIIEESE